MIMSGADGGGHHEVRHRPPERPVLLGPHHAPVRYPARRGHRPASAAAGLPDLPGAATEGRFYGRYSRHAGQEKMVGFV